MDYSQWYNILAWLDGILFFLMACAVSYLFIFAVFSFKKKKDKFNKAKKDYRFLVLFTTRDFNKDIYKSLRSFYNQDFPEYNYDIALVSRNIPDSVVKDFENSPVILIKHPKEIHCRSRIIEYALNQMDTDYDIILIMKSGNTVEHSFLTEINKAYHSGGMAIQTHCTKKNMKSNTAILNALSEEINNSIFRRGHVNLGFSSSLIGTGMAFNYHWFKHNIRKVKNNGLTKQLETRLLKQGIFIEYLENLYTYEESEKSKSKGERRNWYASKFKTLINVIGDLPNALMSGNFDYSDKIIQWIIPSRFLLLFVIVAVAIGLVFVDWIMSIKWFGLLFYIMLVFDLGIPKKLYNWRSFYALFSLPILIILNFFNIFRIDRK